MVLVMTCMYLRENESNLLRLAQVRKELVELEQGLVGLEVIRSRFHLHDV